MDILYARQVPAQCSMDPLIFNSCIFLFSSTCEILLIQVISNILLYGSLHPELLDFLIIISFYDHFFLFPIKFCISNKSFIGLNLKMTLTTCSSLLFWILLLSQMFMNPKVLSFFFFFVKVKQNKLSTIKWTKWIKWQFFVG